jgi:GT2 family glycosyltransferase
VADQHRAVAALLLNFRRPDLTAQCLADLLAVTDVALHVLLIDNGSGDGSAAQLEAMAATAAGAGRRVEVLLLPQNVGYAAAMNRGIAWASAAALPFVLLLNNDLRLPAAGLSRLVEVLVNDAAVAAVGPTLLAGDGRVWAEGGALGFAANLVRLRAHGNAPAPTTAGPEAVTFVPGACLLARTADLAAIGGFDESLFLYWEDVELCRRLQARGRLLWLPWVRAVHAGGQSSGGGRSPLRKYCMALNSVRFLRRHGTARLWLAFVVCDLLTWPLLLLVPGGQRAALAKGRGLLAGLRGGSVGRADVDRYLPLSR